MKPAHSLKVKIVESNNRKVKIRLMNANRELSVPTKTFKQRCDRGFYDVVNSDQIETSI